jgi:hypothetical protein
MRMRKTRESEKRAVKNHSERYGYVNYFRRVKPEWKIKLDELLKTLRGKE